MTTTGSSGYGATFPTDTASQSGTSDTSTTDVAKEQAGQVASSAKDQATQVAGSAKESAAQVASTAKDSASQVASTASEKAGQVASTTMEQAQEVVAEATSQARVLAGELKTQASEQAGVQRDRIVEQLHAMGDELRQMVQGGGGQSGVASELAGEIATRVTSAATYLDGKDPEDLLVAAKDYARRKPGTFLIGAALAGLVAGRLTRGVRAASSDDDVATGYAPTYAPSVPASTYAPAIPSSTYPTTMSSAAGFSSTYDEPATGYVGGTVLDDTTTTYDDPYATGTGTTQGQRL